MAPIMALIPNIFKATSMSLLFVSTAAKLRSLDSKRSWASLPTKTPFRCGCYLNLHQMDKHIPLYALGKGDVLLLPAEVGACLCRPRGAVSLLDISLPEGA